MITRNTMTESEVRQAEIEKTMNAVNVWASFYRANPHRFAKDYLGLKLDIFQQIILCMMFRDANCIYLASRGGGKSFLIAVFCVCYAILYPDSRICLASKTRKQATEIIDKVNEILVPMSENLKAEISEIQINQTNAFVSFLNGSRMIVVTATENARHNRATVLVVDEFRMVDKNTIDTVLRKFLTSQRHPPYLDKPEYSNYPREQTKEIYASSCWYEAHWSYEQVRSYVVNMIRGRSYFCCAIPYQLMIKEGRLDREKIENEMSETTFNRITFQMEMEALFFGQSDGGLYSFDDLDKLRKIRSPFYPRSMSHKIADKKLLLPSKKPGEKRVLSADIALMSSEKNKNDATSIILNQMVPLGNGRYAYNIVFVDSNEGLRTDAQALVLRKYFAEFDCDYLVLDTNGLGLGVSDALMTDIYDPQDGNTYGALSCYNNSELASRCLIKDAPKVIYSIKGQSEFNSQCAITLREAIKQGQIRLLISEYDAEDVLGELRGYNTLEPADALYYKMPYIQTTLMINELINLEYETKNSAIKVKEKSGWRKDRYSSLSYNIFVAKVIEREIASSPTQRTIEDMVFNFRAPKTKRIIRGGF